VTEPVWLLLTRYVRPLPEVDALRADHLAHLERQREAGHFVLWGRLVPPSGGFVVARGLDRPALDAVLAEDPFTTGGVAEWAVHELAVSGGAPGLLAALTGGGAAGPAERAPGTSAPGG
jgi:uncharacterized protein YciI